MGQINLANSRGRDATVTTETVAGGMTIKWVDAGGRAVRPVRILRGTIDRDLESLATRAGGIEKVAAELIAGDPEIDLETYGTLLGPTSRVYVSPDRQVVTKVDEWEVVRNPDGSERDRRPRKILHSNTHGEVPLRWSGKLMKKADVVRRFVLAAKLQITHTNGLTYDFLFDMARDLHEKDSLLLVGGGAKGNQPLVFQRGGTPYRGFLEGRIQGDKYLLCLHLANLELKRPTPPGDEAP
jgi:hypothetical protein